MNARLPATWAIRAWVEQGQAPAASLTRSRRSARRSPSSAAPARRPAHRPRRDSVGRPDHRAKNQRGTEGQRRDEPGRRPRDGERGDHDETHAELSPRIGRMLRRTWATRSRAPPSRAAVTPRTTAPRGPRVRRPRFSRERHRESDDHEHKRGFQPAPMGDRGDNDCADDLKRPVRPADCRFNTAPNAAFSSTGRAPEGCRASSNSAVRTGVPQTRHGSPARR